MMRNLPPSCEQCGLELPGAHDQHVRCRRCRVRAWAFERTRAPFVYAGAAREAIHAFKYQGHQRLGRWLAEAMAQTAGRELPLAELDAVVPVPPHWLKRRIRGADPVAFLAQEVAQRLRLPCDARAIRRARWTASQTRLSSRQRARNVRDAFRARAASPPRQTVLLIDDVLTTGATAHACALALRATGVARVVVLAAAATRHPS